MSDGLGPAVLHIDRGLFSSPAAEAYPTMIYFINVVNALAKFFDRPSSVFRGLFEWRQSNFFWGEGVILSGSKLT